MSTNIDSTYTCRICGLKFASLKGLTGHYEKEHPEMIEDLMMPI